jgi:hypothetical protein
MNWKLILTGLAIAGGVNWYLYERPVSHPAGILVPELPRVSSTDRRPWTEADGLRYRPLKRLHIRARLLSRSNVKLGSWADISPVDLGLGWGRMSDSGIIEQLDMGEYNAVISGTRFLSISIRRDAPMQHWPPAERDAIFSQLTHLHAIPADDSIEKALKGLRPGQVLSLDGQLVQISDPRGNVRLTSSTILGDRNCEVMWVESLALSDAGAASPDEGR